MPKSAGMSAALVPDVGARLSRTWRRRRGSPRASSGRASIVKRHATTTETNTTSESSSTRHLGVKYTYLGGNSWFAEFGVSKLKVLCDPWLVGDLTFWNLPALYTGRKASLNGQRDEWISTAQTADVILLSQGWEDHCHVPTLELLPKDTPVVGSVGACLVVKELGFVNVTSMRAGETVAVRRKGVDKNENAEEALIVIASAGAQVGPPWSERECGFFLVDGAGRNTGAVIYYEPHCSYDPNSVRAGLQNAGGTVDLCITPIRSVDVLGFPLVSGADDAVDLLQVLNQPKRVAPLRNGELTQVGAATALIGTDGTTGEKFAELCDKRFGTGKVSVAMPTPGVPIEI